jgi:formamidase
VSNGESTAVVQRVSGDTAAHNRWHPAIEPVLTIASGDTVVVDVPDSADGRITAESTAADLARLGELPMAGPIAVSGAMPGDVLRVELLEFTPDAYGWSGIVPELTTLKDRFAPYVVSWEVREGIARSPQIPGVRIRARPHLGVVGVAPSVESLARWTARETALARRTGRPLPLPDPRDARPPDELVARDGLLPGPPRENGGNLDLRQMTIGSRLDLRVQVPGALLSVGDPHFAQGDGESLSSAIEMRCRARLRVTAIPQQDAEWLPTFASVTWSPERAPERGEQIVTTGLPVDFAGTNHLLDLNVAAERALDEMVRYLTEVRGYAPEQAAIIISVAADVRASQIVNVPNAVVSVALPLEIFG